MSMLSLFAAEEGPHVSLKAEKLFELGGFTITNSILYGVVAVIFMLVIGLYVGKRTSVKPKSGVIQIVEMGVEFIVNLLEGSLGSKKKAYKYAPYFATFFLFIIVSNLSGLMPWVGPGVHLNTAEGAVPLFRPFTADLNGTIALALIAIVLVQTLSIKESGFLGHLKHYFTDKPFNPINFFIGILEVLGELTRVMSLSLRLFLNTAVGEILIAVFAFVGKNGASFTLLPIVLFEVLVALIQAYVFTVLAATYLGLAIAHGHEHDEDDHQEPVELKTQEALA